MKKALLTLGLVAGLAACSTVTEEACPNEPENKCPAEAPVVQQPVAMPQQQPAPTGYVYTVSQPVEVVYRNTTYRTVYEPKTYSSVAYTKKPYNCGDGDICKNAYTVQGVQQ